MRTDDAVNDDPEYKALLKQMQKLSDAEKAEMDRLDTEAQIPYASDYQVPGSKEYKDMQRVSFDEWIKKVPPFAYGSRDNFLINDPDTNEENRILIVSPQDSTSSFGANPGYDPSVCYDPNTNESITAEFSPIVSHSIEFKTVGNLECVDYVELDESWPNTRDGGPPKPDKGDILIDNKSIKNIPLPLLFTENLSMKRLLLLVHLLKNIL